MFKIDGNNRIFLTKGDTAYFSVCLIKNKLPCGKFEYYNLLPDDKIFFTLRDRYTNEIILQKEIIGSNTFALLPDDTNDLSENVYNYDCQLTSVNGIFTIIPLNQFYLEGEVTYE